MTANQPVRAMSAGEWLGEPDQARLLLDISRAVASTLDPDRLYSLALDRLHDLIPFAGAVIATRSNGAWVQVAARRPAEIGDGFIERLPGWSESSWSRDVAAGKAFVVDDIRGDDPRAAEYRSYLPVPIEDSPMRYFRSVMEVPLLLNGETVGDISVSHERPGYFTSAHLELVSAVGGFLVIAMQNARLFSQAQERTREMASLLEVSRSVAGTHDTESLARSVLDEFRNVMHYGNASLLLREGSDLRIVYANSRDDSSPRDEVIGIRFAVANAGPIWERMLAGQPLVVDENRDDGYWSKAYQQIVGDLYDTTFASVRSWLGVPLRVRNETIGFMTISAPEPRQFGQAQVDLAMAFAAQVSVAFENSELLRQAHALAAAEERQRLARELHDSVSQALYGIALGARTARTQLDRDAAAAVEPIDYVLSLAEAGLAEMRALIFELRPESLATEGLVAALEKHAAAVRARHGLAVDLSTGEEPELSIPAKEAIYRIAQEAMHNVVKHARAEAIRVTLSQSTGSVQLRVADDGVGFDPAQEFPGHLGLQSMRERAATVGGTLSVSSAPGEGSTVVLQLPSGANDLRGAPDDAIGRVRRPGRVDLDAPGVEP